MHRYGYYGIAALVVASLMQATPARADVPALDLSPLSASSSVPLNEMAPMDEEFGQYHLTPLGIGNTITAAGARFSDAASRDELSSGSFALAIDALRDMERAYPHDPLIARDLARVAHTFARIHNADAREFASRTVVWLERDYAGSAPAKAARIEVDLALNDQQPQNVDATFATIEAPPPVPAQAPEIPSYAQPLSTWQAYDASRNR